LVTSKEIEDRYGEAPVFITFEYGDGKIYHMISHFYLQRIETRTKRHSAKAEMYLNEKEIPTHLRAKYDSMGIANSNVAEVESALTSSVMMNKIMIDKKRQMRRRKNNE